MSNAYSVTRGNAIEAYQLDNYELHNRVERCAPLRERIYGEVPPEHRDPSKHSLTLRRYPWTAFQDVLINPQLLQTGKRILHVRLPGRRQRDDQPAGSPCC